jgi:hypothetical protein
MQKDLNLSIDSIKSISSIHSNNTAKHAKVKSILNNQSVHSDDSLFDLNNIKAEQILFDESEEVSNRSSVLSDTIRHYNPKISVSPHSENKKDIEAKIRINIKNIFRKMVNKYLKKFLMYFFIGLVLFVMGGAMLGVTLAILKYYTNTTLFSIFSAVIIFSGALMMSVFGGMYYYKKTESMPQLITVLYFVIDNMMLNVILMNKDKVLCTYNFFISFRQLVIIYLYKYNLESKQEMVEIAITKAYNKEKLLNIL